MALNEAHNPNTGTTQSGRIAKGGGTHVLVTFLLKGLIEHKAQLEMQEPKEPYVFVQIINIFKNKRFLLQNIRCLPWTPMNRTLLT
jgi:hypothetical protein